MNNKAEKLYSPQDSNLLMIKNQSTDKEKLRLFVEHKTDQIRKTTVIHNEFISKNYQKQKSKIFEEL